MTQPEWESLRVAEPELQLPEWSELNHVPTTRTIITAEEVRACAVALRLNEMDEGHLTRFIPFVNQMQQTHHFYDA